MVCTMSVSRIIKADFKNFISFFLADFEGKHPLVNK